MEIISYRYWQINPEWYFSKVNLGKLNLVVGDTSTGKTRFLNTIFNLGKNAVGTKNPKNGCWDLELKENGVRYGWKIESEEDVAGENVVRYEHLWKWEKDKQISIIDRNMSTFSFLGKEIPKLSKQATSISLLKEEEEIKPLHEGFSKIMKRDFFSDALSKSYSYDSIWPDFYEDLKELHKLFASGLGVNARLYVLSKNFPEIFEKITKDFKEIFPFIINIGLKDLKSIYPKFRAPGMVPTIAIKERKINKWVAAGELSSGMQKVLLILTDVYSMPEGGVYLIDEYENSLGINAINFFPDFLSKLEKQIQFILTSHHPYIINNIPPENWLIIHRTGDKVKVRYGNENMEIFSKSRQQRFIQLINDPFYTEGVE